MLKGGIFFGHMSGSPSLGSINSNTGHLTQPFYLNEAGTEHYKLTYSTQGLTFGIRIGGSNDYFSTSGVRQCPPPRRHAP